MDDPERLGPAWDEALAADSPVVLEVRTDPEVPPLPPHITFTQARHFAHAVLQGDPRRGSMVKSTARQLLSRLLGRRSDVPE